MRLHTAVVAGLLFFSSSSLFATVARADEPPPYGPPAPSDVRVRVNSDPDVQGRADLFALGADSTYSWICTAPCTTTLPAGADIALRLERSSDPARRTVSRRLGSEVDVNVSKPSRTDKIVGASLLVAGLATVTAAIVTAVALTSADNGHDFPVGAITGFMIGVPVGFVGLALAGFGGGVLAAASDAPSVKVSRSEPRERRP